MSTEFVKTDRFPVQNPEKLGKILIIIILMEHTHTPSPTGSAREQHSLGIGKFRDFFSVESADDYRCSFRAM